MRTKRVAVVSVITFMLGGFGGAGYAYVTHPTPDGQIALPVNLEQAQENWAVEQFINEQEELHPDGLEESKIETGSKYTGINYNNIGTATVKKKDAKTNTQNTNTVEPETIGNKEQDKTDQKQGLLSKLFGKKDKNEVNDKNDKDDKKTETNSGSEEGRIVVQEGSLNVRSKGELDAKIIGKVYKNDTVQIIGQAGNWYHIKTKDGLQGYVSATYVDKLSGLD